MIYRGTVLVRTLANNQSEAKPEILHSNDNTNGTRTEKEYQFKKTELRDAEPWNCNSNADVLKIRRERHISISVGRKLSITYVISFAKLQTYKGYRRFHVKSSNK